MLSPALAYHPSAFPPHPRPTTTTRPTSSPWISAPSTSSNRRRTTGIGQGGLLQRAYFSLKSTILDGRVLRSRTIPGIEQEVYALLTVYQALVRVASDVVTAQPSISAERVSLIVLLNAAADQIVASHGITLAGPAVLIGAIGRAALASLVSPGQRWRLKARVRKRNSKYTFTSGKHPRTCQAYILDFEMLSRGP